MKLHELLEEIGKGSSKPFVRKSCVKPRIMYFFGIDEITDCIYVQAIEPIKRKGLANLSYEDLIADDWELLEQIFKK